MERIGDLAANMAERAEFLGNQPLIAVPFDLEGLAAKSQRMLKDSLDALVNLNVKLARDACRMDDEVDAIYRDMYDLITEAIRAKPGQVGALIPYLSISR